MKVGEVLFSGGTYQVQIEDPAEEQGAWPLLNYNDQGACQDALCSCDVHPCPHLPLAKELIQGSQGVPLHLRWRGSFWKALAQGACDEWSYAPPAFTRSGQTFVLEMGSDQPVELVAKDLPAAEWLDLLTVHRMKETEENSLKFSHRTPEEIADWRAGHPGAALRFELSVWADLGKAAFVDQAKGELLAVEWEGPEGKLPHAMVAQFTHWQWRQPITPAMWALLVPTLGTVPSSLQEMRGALDEMTLRFDPQGPSFRIEGLKAKAPTDVATGERVADWRFVPREGFVRLTRPNLDALEAEGRESVTRLLQHHADELALYLKGTPMHLSGTKPLMQLAFDSQWNLHISMSLKEPGDLDRPGVQLLGSWVYIPSAPHEGLWKLEGMPFHALDLLIPPKGMDDFIARHKAFLNTFPGFTTHLTTIETQTGYLVTAEGSLKLINLLEHSAEKAAHDFGEWVYLPGQGFYAKMSGQLGQSVRAGTTVPPKDVPGFIRQNREDLALIQGFFASRSPIERIGLRIATERDKGIVITPEMVFRAGVNARDVRFYGDYVFTFGEGFWELPPGQRLPEDYQKPQRISPEHVNWFIAKELEALRPFALSIDPKLTWAEDLELLIEELKDEKGQWFLKVEAVSAHGRVNAVQIWDAIRQQRGYLISEAGLIDLSQPQFHWMKAVARNKVDLQREGFKMSQLELMRLSLLGAWELDAQKTEARTILERVLSTETDVPCNTEGFLSNLRPYQQTGLHWLWSLYCHDLGALLCDDMGLGKTHQAMGLLSAVANQAEQEGRSPRFLVVCPTSVIYHWQSQLERFLPNLKSHVFHGLGRSVEQFQREGHILLTSYGILRTSKQALDGLNFDVAVFDELQYAKNAQSHTHAALCAIRAKMPVGLSGTPIENNLKELKALFDVVLPGYMPGEAAYRELFINPIEKQADPQRREMLTRFIRPFVLRRKKSEVLQDLPEKIEEIASCELSDEQRKLYNEVLQQGRAKYLPELMDDQTPIPYVHIFSLLASLKQICDHPALYLKEATSYRHHQSGKWDLFCELLQEARDSGQKVVVFSHYLKMLDLMEEYLRDQVVGYAAVRGSTLNRAQELERFRRDPDCQVFLGSLGAVGVGVDLSAASVVIHYDRWWNAAREDQATDRVHRMGQTRGVQVFKMVTRGTIEEKIDAMIARKGTLLQEVIKAEDQEVLRGFDRKELIELLQMIEPPPNR